MYFNVGAEDPCLNSANRIDFHLQRMIKSWKSSNPAPLHFKPIPIQVIQRVASLSQLSSMSDFLCQATTNMITLAFLFLLLPGEYTDNNETPFCLKDVQLFIGPCSLNLQTFSMAELAQVHPLLHPFHGFSTHRPELHHKFSPLPSETLSSILAPILGFFLPKSPLEVFGPREQQPSS